MGQRPGHAARRQFAAFGLAELHVYFEYVIIFPVPSCGQYCEGYWYDALGYSQLIVTQPPSADWPSIVYTYPFLPVPVPVLVEEISMAGSAATAWSPPVISVSPNRWPAGTTTTFTISGAGFGYSPILSISGTGIVTYTNPCGPPSSSPSCDTQIVATVTIDANTPSGTAETITVTANGLNPSGFLPVPIEGQSGQASAQATTTAAPPPLLQIIFSGRDVLGQPNPQVYSGQKIALTAVVSNVPQGQTVQSQWSLPSGIAVGGYNPTTQQAA